MEGPYLTPKGWVGRMLGFNNGHPEPGYRRCGRQNSSYRPPEIAGDPPTRLDDEAPRCGALVYTIQIGGRRKLEAEFDGRYQAG